MKKDNVKDLEEDLDDINENEDETSEEEVKAQPKKTDEEKEVEKAVAEAYEDEDKNKIKDKKEEAVVEKKEEVDAEREKIRARRREEKKLLKERQRRERFQMQNTIVSLQDELKKTKEELGSIRHELGNIDTKSLDSEMSQLGQVYRDAERIMQQAVADGDGEKFVKAKAISDKAWARYNQLEVEKRIKSGTRKGVAPETSSEKTGNEKPETKEAPQWSERTQQLATQWAKKHASWYDVNGGNQDSKIMMAIDIELVNEGYDPDSLEYWEELTERGKEVLPHRFASQTPRKKPGQIVGGSGGDDTPSGNPPEKTIPPEFVQTLKAAGYWDDPAKRKAAIKNYHANKRRAS